MVLWKIKQNKTITGLEETVTESDGIGDEVEERGLMDVIDQEELVVEKVVICDASDVIVIE